jgi:hypothetical protein
MNPEVLEGFQIRLNPGSTGRVRTSDTEGNLGFHQIDTSGADLYGFFLSKKNCVSSIN